MMTSKVVPKTRLAWNVEGKGLHKPALIVYLYYKKKKLSSIYVQRDFYKLKEGRILFFEIL
jgi:hypothetical protein